MHTVHEIGLRIGDILWCLNVEASVEVLGLEYGWLHVSEHLAATNNSQHSDIISNAEAESASSSHLLQTYPHQLQLQVWNVAREVGKCHEHVVMSHQVSCFQNIYFELTKFQTKFWVEVKEIQNSFNPNSFVSTRELTSTFNTQDLVFNVCYQKIWRTSKMCIYTHFSQLYYFCHRWIYMFYFNLFNLLFLVSCEWGFIILAAVTVL